MSITFISQNQAIVWALTVISALAFYVLLVRPRIKHRPEFIRFRGNVLGWLKARWDMVAAMVIAALPSLWNGLLDLSIALSHVLADALPVMAGMDLSGLVLPDWLTTSIRVGAPLVPIFRKYLFKDEE